ncbi:glycosyltransferase [Candidatus Leptofilum sp.]|uniref:glycosyltransferase n=1 Tax=Candidatus Leptofilum sp. TaxID=3241576 RepID=UPI003B5C3252
MVSVLITAYREAATIGPALDAFLPQLPPNSELLVICPDTETTAVVHQYAARHPQVRHVPEPDKRGKPAALNLGLQAAQGDLVVFSDGDVVIGENALAPLLAPFADEKVGAVTGRPFSNSPRQTKLGYWSHVLVEGAHQTRKNRHAKGDFLLCSGYLFAARRELIDPIPEDALAEDAVISHRIAEQEFTIRYAPEAAVFVKYPDNYADWLRQKVRSAGGYAQDYVRNSRFSMRSARLEAQQGTRLALKFAQTPRELWWTMLLFLARLHLWLLVFWRVRVLKRPLTTLWQRVESTK